MESAAVRYRRSLDLTSHLELVALGALVWGLALGLAGLEVGTLVFASVTLAGLWRPRGSGEFPGTLALAPWQAPGLYHLVESLARRAGLRRLPEVRLVPGGQTNAAASLRGSTPVLLVTEALLHRLDTRRLGAVLAHETAHLAHRDLETFRLALTYQSAAYSLGLVLALSLVVWPYQEPLVTFFWLVAAAGAPSLARLLTAALSRTREFAADLGAARLTGDPLALADALEIIEYRPRTWWEVFWGRRSPVADAPSERAFRSHPPTPERVRRLDALAEAR